MIDLFMVIGVDKRLPASPQQLTWRLRVAEVDCRGVDKDNALLANYENCFGGLFDKTRVARFTLLTRSSLELPFRDIESGREMTDDSTLGINVWDQGHERPLRRAVRRDGGCHILDAFAAEYRFDILRDPRVEVGSQYRFLGLADDLRRGETKPLHIRHIGEAVAALPVNARHGTWQAIGDDQQLVLAGGEHGLAAVLVEGKQVDE